jgi:recombination protein RecA
MTKIDIRKSVGSIDLTNRFADLIKFRIPTGIIAFDKILNGGIPAGKLTEIYGDFSSGKSRIACHILAETQKLGGLAVLLDTERSLDKGLIDLTGIDIGSLVYPDPSTMLATIEDVFKIITDVMKFREENKTDLLTIVWDSVAATPDMEDLENQLGASTAAMRRAKVISDGLKQVMAEVYRTQTCLIFINQVRDKIGVMYGEKTETVGGKALKYTASMRVHVALAGKIKDEDGTKEQIGNKGRMVVDKCKVGKPFGMVNFDMMIDKPFEKYTGLLDYEVRHGLVEDCGRGWYKYPGDKEKFRESDFPEIYEKANE